MSDDDQVDDEYLDDDEAAHSVGVKVIEMADRVAAMDEVAPGAVASWAFEIDGKRFGVTVAREHIN